MANHRHSIARNRVKAAALAALVGALGTWVAAQAFTVQHFEPVLIGIQFDSDPNHEDITREGLKLVVATLSTSDLVGFTQKTIEYVANKDAQTDSLFYDVAMIHFDAETFLEGNARLQAMRTAIGNYAISGDYELAQLLLGRALHSVQDFYAHSTWVEQNPSRTDLAPLGRPGLFAPHSVGPTCTARATQTLDTVQTGLKFNSDGSLQLSSEYFAYGQEVPQANIYWYDDVVTQKCIHGVSDLTNNAASLLGGYGYGINKDSALRDFYIEAAKLARFATLQYVNDIIGDISSNPGGTAGDQAICGLLGQEDQCESPKGCFGKVTSLMQPGSTYSLTQTGITSGLTSIVQTNYVAKGVVAFADAPFTSIAYEQDSTVTSQYPTSPSSNQTSVELDYDAPPVTANPSSWVTYGSTQTVTNASGKSSVTKGTFSTPVANWMLMPLAVGSSVIITYAGTGTTTTGTTTHSGTFNYIESWTLLGTPTITVPAGTFKTCNFQVTNTLPGNLGLVYTHWWLYGYPISIQEKLTDSSTGDVSNNTQASSLSINRVPYTGP